VKLIDVFFRIAFRWRLFARKFDHAAHVCAALINSSIARPITRAKASGM
jgi:hypothetical protein